MPIPTTRVHAEIMVARLRERLTVVHPDLVATIIEPTRGNFQIAVVLTDDNADGIGLAFSPRDLDNGASGIAEAAMHAIMQLAGEELPSLSAPESRPGLFVDVMTTTNTSDAPDPAVIVVTEEEAIDPFVEEVVDDESLSEASTSDDQLETTDDEPRARRGKRAKISDEAVAE